MKTHLLTAIDILIYSFRFNLRLNLLTRKTSY